MTVGEFQERVGKMLVQGFILPSDEILVGVRGEPHMRICELEDFVTPRVHLTPKSHHCRGFVMFSGASFE